MLGSRAFLELLADEGVTHLFGNPGTTELPLMAALPSCPDLTYVLGLQESAVVAMSDGFARASGRLGVANVHVAPGLGNAMGSLFNAYWLGSPLLVTAGQHEIGHGLMEPMLYAPLEPLASPVVKWSAEVTRLADLPRLVRRAVKTALAPPTGPVFLSLPGDVLDADEELDLGRSHRVVAATRPSREVLAAMAARLLAAERPLIVSGHEVNTTEAIGPVATLAELLGAGVYQDTIATAATFRSAHPCYLGRLGRDQADVARRLSEHDVLLCLGTDLLRMSVPGPAPVPTGLPVLQIGEREADLAKNYPTELAVQANVRETVRALNEALRDRRTTEQADAARRRCEELAQRGWAVERKRLVTALDAQSGTGLTPELLMLRLADVLPEDAVVVDEGLTSTGALPKVLAQRDHRSYYGLASGGIGFAVAGAVGMRLAIPDRPLVAIIGDGSALYNIQALWTAAHHQLPMVYVIANNGGYRILKQRVRAWPGGDAYVGMSMDEPRVDFTALARSMGVRAERVEAADQVGPALTAALAHPGPSLLEVPLPDAP